MFLETNLSVDRVMEKLSNSLYDGQIMDLKYHWRGKKNIAEIIVYENTEGSQANKDYYKVFLCNFVNVTFVNVSFDKYNHILKKIRIKNRLKKSINTYN